MGLELIGGSMDQLIKDNFMMVFYMEKEYGNLNKMTAIKESIDSIKNMVKELIHGVMELFLVEISKIKEMESMQIIYL